MNINVINIVKNILPPILFSLLRGLFVTRKNIRFKGPFSSWDSALMQCSGYEADEILDKVLSSTLKVKLGNAKFERDSVLFDEIQYSWPLTSALLLAAARNKGELSVLDFGGSLGSSYFQNKKFVSLLKEIRWSVVEQEHFVEAGIKRISDENLKFYKKIVDCVKVENPNVILLSSVLQYLATPYAIIEEITDLQVDVIVVDRTPVLLEGVKDEVNLQIIPSVIYEASYPIHFFFEDNLIKAFKKGGYELIEKFQALDNLHSSASWVGFIFKRDE